MSFLNVSYRNANFTNRKYETPPREETTIMFSIGQQNFNITIIYHPSELSVSQNCKYFNIHENFTLNLHINE